jgi:hypothetical protein
MHPNEPVEGGQEGRSAMQAFGKDARVEARMLKEGETITAAQRTALRRDLKAYRDDHLIGGKPTSWAKIASCVGVAASTLSEWSRATYRADDDRICRMVDQFLSREEQQASGTNIRGFKMLRLVVEVMLAAVTQAIKRHSICVITGEPGSGKTAFAKWFAERNDGACLITCKKLDCDAKFIVDKLHERLGLGTYTPHARAKSREIEAYLVAHKNTIILVDESQHLTADALEILRSLHDLSDPEGMRNVPVILLGDEDFLKVIVRSRGGERTPISPQFTSRVFPLVSLERQGVQVDDDGQAVPNSVYTAADIEAIVKNQRLRLVRPDAIAWVTKLANIHRHGRLRLAARVLEIAIDIKRGAQVTVDDLRAALDLFAGPSEAKLCVEEIKQLETTAIARAG